jgi:hypothetical protein
LTFEGRERYVWFIFFHHVGHPAEMAEPEINAFLTHLAFGEKVSASTQNQALSALLFLYRHVLGRPIGDLGEVVRARRPTRLPVVLTRAEVKAVLAHLTGDKWRMAILMYGAGSRLDDLHPRVASGWQRGAEPGGRLVVATARQGCYTVSVNNPERLGPLPVTIPIFKANGTPGPRAYRRTLCQR